MKILAFVTDAFGGYGGIARYNRDFLKLIDQNHRVSKVLVSPRIGNDDEPTGSRSIFQLPPAKGRLRYSFRAFYDAIKFKPDIIINGHLYHSPLSFFVAKICGAKLVSQLHGTEVWGDISLMNKYSLKKSDHILCVSDDTRNRITSKIQIPDTKISVLHNTVGDEFSIGDRASARSKFSISEEECVLLSVGRLDNRDGYKGHDRVINLLPKIMKGFSAPVKYLIAGVGPDEGRLKALTKEKGVEGSVKFLGRVPNNDLPDLYRASDLFVLPSRGEGFGIVYIEAMACGTPAIGLEIGGVRDAFLSGRIGHLVGPDKFESSLLPALISARKMSEKDRYELSRKTIDAFGRNSFAKAIDNLLDRIL